MNPFDSYMLNKVRRKHEGGYKGLTPMVGCAIAFQKLSVV